MVFFEFKFSLMRIKILSQAISDLENGFYFYEKQANGLGAYFLDSLFSDIDSLILYAGIHPKVFGYNRLLSKRFPYAVYYEVQDHDVVIVWRILDLRQHPAKLKSEIDG